MPALPCSLPVGKLVTKQKVGPALVAACAVHESANGTKRTSQACRSISAFGGKADIAKQVARMSEAKPGRSRPHALGVWLASGTPSGVTSCRRPECSDR